MTTQPAPDLVDEEGNTYAAMDEAIEKYEHACSRAIESLWAAYIDAIAGTPEERAALEAERDAEMDAIGELNAIMDKAISDHRAILDDLHAADAASPDDPPTI